MDKNLIISVISLIVTVISIGVAIYFGVQSNKQSKKIENLVKENTKLTKQYRKTYQQKILLEGRKERKYDK